MTRKTISKRQQFDKELASAERALAAPKNSLVLLLQEDDWSCVIKAHALLEGALSFMLTTAVDHRLERVFAKLTVGQATGKLAFAEALGLLNKGEVQFVRMLSELRNMAAHNHRHVRFNIKRYVAKLDTGPRRAFMESVVAFGGDNTRPLWSRLAATEPKKAMVAGTMALICKCVLTGQGHKKLRHAARFAVAYLDMVQTAKA